MNTYEQKKKKNGMNTATGIGSGDLLGALIAGPPGAVVGALIVHDRIFRGVDYGL